MQININTERFWKVVDRITTTCPVCAFGRGVVLGAAVCALIFWR